MFLFGSRFEPIHAGEKDLIVIFAVDPVRAVC
jgi:hypothetical protein